jgi:hypothetical protein
VPPPHPEKRATHTRSTIPTRQTGAAEGNFSGEGETAFGFWVTMGLFFSVILIGLVGLVGLQKTPDAFGGIRSQCFDDNLVQVESGAA